MKRTTAWLGLLAVLALPAAEAANQEIRALYQPDPAQPGKNVFVNKTPSTGYCTSYPADCAAGNRYSFRVPVRFDSVRAINGNQEVGFKVPANWRSLTVTNPVTQKSETVEVRISGIGSEYVLSYPAGYLVGLPGSDFEGHKRLWTTGRWDAPGSNCNWGTQQNAYTPTTYRFFWNTPQEGWCQKRLDQRYRLAEMSFNTVDFVYELRMPNPLVMSSGLYTGALTYTLGPGGDFEMGPGMQPNDGSLTLNFTLDVQHTLKVDLPPGGNKVVLEPAGGWQRWIDGGRRPTEIFRNQPFFLSSSSRFKVMLQCSSLGGPDCNIGNNQVGYSKFQIRLTMPPGIVGPGGADGWSSTLEYNTWLGPFEPGRYIDRKQGMLRFFISPRFLDFLKPGMNGTLTGDATIIFDSEA
ncbi:hypothetical protein DLD99_23170 [Pseudomonas kribbensis]|uniref:Uncharacterized protein n=1 Tax=Pseudomonas kribbensis TaxID=1628086 RepID=A0A345RVE1_9PSED|nr:hypothetical protein [Pseudomonas kribbensis]AXI63257.1 hypothetical protein DLD99_23170 [Pseudomonas kribbensis]